MAQAPGKETVYVDVEDEITSLIDKVNSSEQKIVALVLPKRAAVLQSIVNMKLLKRAADDSKKKVVLITSEAGVLPLAGTVGIHVARTLSSKPELPAAPTAVEPPVLDARDDLSESDLAQKPIGELAGLPPDDDDVPIEVGDIETDLQEDTTKKNKKGKSPNKKLAVPNFERFRKLFFIGGAVLVLLIIGLIYAMTVLPRANIVIKTDTSSFDTDLTFNAGTNIKQFNEQSLQLPATSKELKKTDTEKVQTTGQKDVGEKASGSVTLKNCSVSDNAVTIPAGTGVSTNSLTYVTNEEVTLPATIKTGGSGTCITPTEDVAVTAQSGGDRFNISEGRTFSVAGYSGVSGSNAAAMAGGTSKIVRVVSQDDIDNAKQKLADRANATAKDEVKKLLEAEGLLGITETLAAGTAAVTANPALNAEGAEVTVSTVTPYTMLGVKEDDLKKIIENSIKDKIDTSKQSILDNGISTGTFKVLEKKPNGEMRLNLTTVVVAGPQLDEDSIKKEVAGKKKGETRSTIQSRPGIRDVEINYSPFWVFSTPKNLQKINIEFQGNDDSDQ